MRVVVALVVFALSAAVDQGAPELGFLHVDDANHVGKPKAPAPLIDRFWLTYWGGIVVASLALYLITSQKVRKSGRDHSEFVGAVASDHVFTGSASLKEDDDVRMSTTPDDTELPHNMWALVLVAAVGQAKFAANDKPISTSLVVVVCMFMSFIQFAALFLMVHDLDPNADPYTVHPSSPFGSPWTVNSMKVIMSIFMVIALVSEAGQCSTVFTAALRIREEKFEHTGSWRLTPLTMEFLQYLVGISVTWCGVAVILSFQSVPDIIYSSMSIMCISGVDEMFFECFDAVFGLEASFQISSDDQDTEREPHSFVHALMKFLLAFPVLLGLFVMSRAWSTGIMPTDRVRTVFDEMLVYLHT